MTAKTVKFLYIGLGAALLLIAAGLALRNFSGAKAGMEYGKAVVVAAIGLFFIFFRGRSRK
ncbi:MAG: hypothetical protein PHX05_08775 [Acidobacteriota bacterium]|jgi:hypothetical protein|nr:hypothetical protein [Acidobacteriota bacterium]